MNTMIREIYKQRYGKVVWFLMALFIVLPIISSMNTTSNWISQNNYYRSNEFVSDYQAHPENYAKAFYFDEKTQKETMILYDSIEEYRADNLAFYASYTDRYLATYQEQRDNRMTIQADENQKAEKDSYQRGTSYSSQWRYTNFSLFILIACAFIGFLCFFVDQKTSFNQFLFSLPVNRKTLFSQKLRQVIAPVIGSLLLGSLLQNLIVYWRIPHEYIHATLAQLLYSAISYTVLAFVVLVVGLFFGILLGNLVFAPLALVIGFYLLVMCSYPFYDGLNSVVTYLFPQMHFLQLSGLIVLEPGKTGSPIWMLCCLLLFSLFILWLARRLYQKISLEHDGEFILVPQVKAMTAILLFIGWNGYFTIGNVFAPIFFTGSTLSIDNVVWLGIQIVSTFLVSYGLVYTGDLRKRWNRRQYKK